ncbi:hypothetical protein [Sphingomonas changbaiensis]|uniref:hypothetical protein n=1 Tax=Sphingomonas changbaiensis TaxID=529705 RepID=UPI0012EE829E|nr:hypothetical protein [Sphingomonas changbaiensis]
MILEELSKPLAPVAEPPALRRLRPARRRNQLDCGCLAAIARLMIWATRGNGR